MSVLKALALSSVLTFVVSGAIHAAKYSGGMLNIAELHMAGHPIAWSWPLFGVAAALIWGIMLIMR